MIDRNRTHSESSFFYDQPTSCLQPSLLGYTPAILFAPFNLLAEGDSIMDILETVMKAGGGAVVQQMAKNFGVGESQAQGALGQLLPALARGLTRNASSSEGLSSLLGALTKGNHQKYIDDPSMLSGQAAVDDGNGILGHIFGSKDVSRSVASRAAEKTGVGADILKKMLPIVASLAMGALGKKAGSLGGNNAQASSGLSGFASFLDFDNDGSIADDLLGMVAKRFF